MTDILNNKSKAHSKDLKEDFRIFYTSVFNVIYCSYASNIMS